MVERMPVVLKEVDLLNRIYMENLAEKGVFKMEYTVSTKLYQARTSWQGLEVKNCKRDKLFYQKINIQLSL